MMEVTIDDNNSKGTENNITTTIASKVHNKRVTCEPPLYS